MFNAKDSSQYPLEGYAKGREGKPIENGARELFIPEMLAAISRRSDDSVSSFTFFVFHCVPSRPFASFAFQDLFLFQKQQVEDLGMERQPEQLLRKGAGGNFGQAGQAGCPMPGTDAEYLHDVPAAHSFIAALAIEMVIKLVGEENGDGTAHIEESRALPGYQPVEQQDRRKIKRDGARSSGVPGKDDDAAEAGIVFAADYRHIAMRRDCRRITPPQLTDLVSQ